MLDIEENDTKENNLNNEINIPKENNDSKNENNLNNQINQIKEPNNICQEKINIVGEQKDLNNENLNLKTSESYKIENKNLILLEEQNKIKNEKEYDYEKSKTEKILIGNILKHENMNKINLISNIEDENNTEIESIKINEYLDNAKGQEEDDNLKSNKEYIDDDSDLRSCRLTPRNNNKYLLIKEDEKQKNYNIIERNDSDDDNEEEEKEKEKEEKKEDLFPFRIVGDAKKKSNHLGKYNNRYLELDSIKGLFKRYNSSKDYPKKPKEIIDIRNFKVIRKIKRIKEFYDLEITYTKTNKKGQTSDKVLNFRLRHLECRNKWFDSLLFIWKYLLKGSPIPEFTNNILLFIDDRIGILQEIGRKPEKNITKNSEISLKKFKILGLLGIGGFGTVFKVKHILTDKIYAMKVMNKNYIIKKKYLHYIVSEFEIMKSLSGFPFILDLHYCFQSANYLYLVIDYCPNGDFTKLKKINNIKLFFAEVILAFEYIHKHNIIYRDLKPENILLDSTGHIRLCDFNLAKAGMTKDKRADSFCGSPMYFSPEMLLGKGVDYKCDIYGIGLLMYEIITGMPAYTATNIQSLYERIKKNQINFRVSGLHGDIKDLIEQILVKEPNERLTLDEIKRHPYFKNIDFDKVLKKEYGKIETEKKEKKNENNIEEKPISEEEKEKLEYEKFKLLQQKMDANLKYTFLDGKITVKEMFLDQKRVMKNLVREFYYVKNEDLEQTKDFQLEKKESIDITSFIIDNYEFEV